MKVSQATLDAYGQLVRDYHQTLDLISPQALADWDGLVADALLYAEIIAELMPEAGSIVDVGSGVGLPGIPLAAVLPAVRLELVERRRRRAAFLNLASGRLGLSNVRVHHADVAGLELESAQVFTAQAVGRFAAVHGLTRHLQGPEVVLVSSKGADWQEEAAELERDGSVSIRASAVRTRKSGSGLVVGLLLAGGA